MGVHLCRQVGNDHFGALVSEMLILAPVFGSEFVNTHTHTHT